jgi:hypothetical protein
LSPFWSGDAEVLITTGYLTVKVATAGVLLLPLLVCNAPADSELMYLPPLLAVTCTVNVQEPWAGIEPPVKVTVEVPTEGIPRQVLPALPDDNMPLGKWSVSGAVRLATVLLGLLKIIVRVDSPPALMVAGLNDLLSVGAMITGVLTVKVATAGAALLPLLVCNVLAGSVLM